ncbi:MAG: hypothetical protein WKF96_19170 [Solirubrobacteraceae bacterium]
MSEVEEPVPVIQPPAPDSAELGGSRPEAAQGEWRNGDVGEQGESL